ncbi:MAG: hypothetical protein QMC67_04980 [Candidatus Wallbacteria bacterium]
MSDIKLLSELTDKRKETSVKILNISQALIISSLKSMKFSDLCNCIKKYCDIDILFAQRFLDELDINELKNKAGCENLYNLTESLDILVKLNKKTAAEILSAADKNALAKSAGRELFENPPAGISTVLYKLSKINLNAAKEIYRLTAHEKLAGYLTLFNSQECLCKHLHYLSLIDQEQTLPLTKYLNIETLFYETNNQPLIYITAILSMLSDIDPALADKLFNKYGAERLAARAENEVGIAFDAGKITLGNFIKIFH